MPFANIVLSLLIFLGLLLGFSFPEAGLNLGPFLPYFLMALMFFVFLKLNTDDFRKIKLKTILVGLFFIIVLMPVLSIAGNLLSPIVFAGTLLAFSCPSAASSAFFSNAFGGSSSLAVTLTTISGLASIVLLPIIMLLGVGTSVTFDPMSILTSLVQIILVPFLIAFLFKRYSKRLSMKLLKHERRISYVIIVFILWGGVSTGAGYVQGNLYEFLQVNVLITILLAIAMSISYSIGRIFGRETAMTFGITTSMKNGILALVVGAVAFGPQIVITLIANLIGQNIILMTIGMLKRK